MKGEEKQIGDAAKKVTGKVNKDTGKVFQKLTKDATGGKFIPKHALGITDAMAESLYSQAYRLYNTGKYNDAIELFRLLVMIDPTEPKYSMGLAACFHMMKDYKSAVGAYMLCTMLDPENPVPHFHASDCYTKMEDRVSTIVALEMTIKRAGENPKYQAMKDRAELTLKKLKEEVKKESLANKLKK